MTGPPLPALLPISLIIGVGTLGGQTRRRDSVGAGPLDARVTNVPPPAATAAAIRRSRLGSPSTPRIDRLGTPPVPAWPGGVSGIVFARRRGIEITVAASVVTPGAACSAVILLAGMFLPAAAQASAAP